MALEIFFATVTENMLANKKRKLGHGSRRHEQPNAPVQKKQKTPATNGIPKAHIPNTGGRNGNLQTNPNHDGDDISQDESENDSFGGFDDGQASSESEVSVEDIDKPSPPVEAQNGELPDLPAIEANVVSQKTFADLGVTESLCDACTALGFTTPTAIQNEAIPIALAGKDIIGLAETGSGKTAAFALPMLQALLDKPQPMFGLVLAPTRELAYQISQQFEALGSGINVRCAVIVGGMDMVPQAISLAKKPHVIVATPGRLMDHLENTKGFSLRHLKYLVMDEADRLLDLDFGPILDKILQVLPRESRRTMLFSATMNTKLDNLTRAALQNPTRVSISSSSYQTVKGLLQRYIFIPHKFKDIYLIALLHEFAGQSCILFSRTVHETQRLAFLLRALGRSAIPLHGQLPQSARLGALNKFRSGSRDILVATDGSSARSRHTLRRLGLELRPPARQQDLRPSCGSYCASRKVWSCD